MKDGQKIREGAGPHGGEETQQIHSPREHPKVAVQLRSLSGRVDLNCLYILDVRLSWREGAAEFWTSLGKMDGRERRQREKEDNTGKEKSAQEKHKRRKGEHERK